MTVSRYYHEGERSIKYPTKCSHCQVTINEGDSAMVTTTKTNFTYILCSKCTDIELARRKA